MNAVLTSLFAAALLHVSLSHPTSNGRIPTDIRAKAARYAQRHPNTDPSVNGAECEVLHEPGQENVFESNPLNAVINPRLKWPDNILYFNISREGYTSDQILKIQEGIMDLQRLTSIDGVPCVQLIPRPSNAYPDYVNVENYSGCSSYVGRIGGRQRLSLVDSCVARHGTIMHEFLHAFGFHHEQCRTDRDDWITVNWDNIQQGYENNFVKYPDTVITLLGTPYDYGSVMHYGAYGFAIDPTVPTIIPHDETAEIGQRVTLSAVDIERVQIHYGCLDPAKSVYFQHLKM